MSRVPPADDDRIVDLVLGLLDEKEREALRARIAADPRAEESLRVQALAMEQARLGEPPRLSEAPDAVTSSRADAATSSPSDATTAARADPRRPAAPPADSPEQPPLLDRILHAIRNPRPPALIGFGLAVMLAVFVFQTQPPPDGMIPALPTGMETMRLRSGESLPQSLEDGIAAYGESRLADAIPLLEEGATDGVVDLVRLTYLGSALARSGRWDDAIRVLDDVVARPLPDPWRSEARWARAVSLREVGRLDEARAALTALAAEEGPAAKRAAAVLERLPAP